MRVPNWLLCPSKPQTERVEIIRCKRIYLCLTKFVKAADPSDTMAWLE